MMQKKIIGILSLIGIMYCGMFLFVPNRKTHHCDADIKYKKLLRKVDDLRNYVSVVDGRLRDVETSNYAPRVFIYNVTSLNISSTTVSRTLLPLSKRVPNGSTLSDFWVAEDDAEDLKRIEEIFGNQNTTSNHSTRLITTRKCSHHYKIIILITTHATNFERRKIIRSTWGNDPKIGKERWKTMFLIARPSTKQHSRTLFTEIKQYGDIIVGSLDEDFYQLTLKIQMGFEWSVKYCSFDYLFKGDDDVFVNLPKLFNFVKTTTSSVGLYAGNVHYAARVRRTGRYGVSKEEFSKSIYPRYCSGGGFILSRDVVERFVPEFHNIPAMKIDDAYIGIVALKIGVDVIAGDNFKMEEKTCKYNDEFITHHPVKDSECMKKLFNANIIARGTAI